MFEKPGDELKRVYWAGLLVAAAVLLTSCTTADEPKGADSAASPALASPTETVTVTEAPEVVCEPPHPAMINLLARSWDLVVASKGASDHPERVENFGEDADELVEDFEDGGCEDTDAMAAAAMLSYETSVLSAYALSGMEPEVGMYRAVSREGSQLVAASGIDGTRFIDVGCVGSVGKTAECSSLDLD